MVLLCSAAPAGPPRQEPISPLRLCSARTVLCSTDHFESFDDSPILHSAAPITSNRSITLQGPCSVAPAVSRKHNYCR